MFFSDSFIFLLLDARDFLLNPQCYVMWQCYVSAPIILKQLFKEHRVLFWSVDSVILLELFCIICLNTFQCIYQVFGSEEPRFLMSNSPHIHYLLLNFLNHFVIFSSFLVRVSQVCSIPVTEMSIMSSFFLMVPTDFSWNGPQFES